jgi:hypothetical protein
MKNLVLSLLVFVLFLMASVTQSHGQLTQQSITQAQWNVLDNVSANPSNLAGFYASISAGSPNPTVPELDLGIPFNAGNSADVTGGWNWGTLYQFTLTNDLGGAYQLTLTQGSNTYQTAIFRPTVPYTDLVIETQGVSYIPSSGIEVTNLTLNLGGTPHSLGSLSAGAVEPQNFQGFVLDGAGSNWTSITGTVTPLGNPDFYPTFGEFALFIGGTANQQIGATPEPSSWALLLVGAGILVCCGRTRASIAKRNPFLR